MSRFRIYNDNISAIITANKMIVTFNGNYVVEIIDPIINSSFNFLIREELVSYDKKTKKLMLINKSNIETYFGL